MIYEKREQKYFVPYKEGLIIFRTKNLPYYEAAQIREKEFSTFIFDFWPYYYYILLSWIPTPTHPTIHGLE